MKTWHQRERDAKEKRLLKRGGGGRNRRVLWGREPRKERKKYAKEWGDAPAEGKKDPERR